MQSYYASRAGEYDRVYQKPERQADLRQIESWLPSLFISATVLEVACGTGYWTQFIAPAASTIVAIDSAPETLRVAEQRVVASNVEFLLGDAYDISSMGRTFSAAFAGFWFSHVPLERQREFLLGLNSALEPGARRCRTIDVEGSSPIAGETNGQHLSATQPERWVDAPGSLKFPPRQVAGTFGTWVHPRLIEAGGTTGPSSTVSLRLTLPSSGRPPASFALASRRRSCKTLSMSVHDFDQSAPRLHLVRRLVLRFSGRSNASSGSGRDRCSTVEATDLRLSVQPKRHLARRDQGEGASSSKAQVHGRQRHGPKYRTVH
jgi:SAM-dependent methyltransferase